jgi:hypothetical protein
MAEIYNEEGKLIATIHDPLAFSQWLDNFERLLEDYSPLQSPMRKLIPHLIFAVDQNTIDIAANAARLLRELRRNLGDDRDGLYPADIPNMNDPSDEATD